MIPDYVLEWARRSGILPEELDRDDRGEGDEPEPWPQSPRAPISPRALQAFRNIGIID